MHEKNLAISILFDFYGEMLRGNQKQAVELYYNDDLSLSEIAQELGITRQGVRDALKRGEETLLHMEETLLLAKRFRQAEQQLTDVSKRLDKLKDTLTPDAQKQIDSIISDIAKIEL